MNHIVLMGRLTSDPERRETKSGTPVTTFTLAVDRRFASRDSGEKTTDFFRVVTWNKTADFVARYFVKGQMTAVAGRLELNEWTDKDNNKRTTAEVVAENVYFTGDKREKGTSSGPADPKESFSTGFSTPVESSDFAELDMDDDDLPF